MHAKSSTSWIAGAALFVTAAALVAAHTGRHLDVAGHPAVPRHGMQDFRDATYYPALAVLDGRNPYDAAEFVRRYPVGSPFPLYAPVALAVHLPLALLPYRAAQALFFAINLLLVPVLAAVALRATGFAAPLGRVLAVGALILLARPGQWNAFTGQCTLYVVLACYAALLWAKTRPSLAGAALALAWLKPTYGGPLSLLLLCRGEWRTVLAGVAVAAAISLPIVLLLLRAAGGIGPLLDSLAANQATFEGLKLVDSATSPYRADAVALVERLAGAARAPALSWIVTAAVLGVAAAALARLPRRPGVPAATMVMCLATLLCIYHLTYDLLLLVLPVAMLAAVGLDPAAARAWRIGAVALLALLAVPAANYFATESAARAFDLGGAAWQVATAANAVAVLAVFGACVVAALWPRLPLPHAAPEREPAAVRPLAIGARR